MRIFRVDSYFCLLKLIIVALKYKVLRIIVPYIPEDSKGFSFFMQKMYRHTKQKYVLYPVEKKKTDIEARRASILKDISYYLDDAKKNK